MSTVERMLETIDKSRVKKLSLPYLQHLLLDIEPALRTDPRKREVLGEVVERGVAEGKLRAPVSRKRWSGNPPLPEWVIATRSLPVQPATVPGRDYFWRPELQWAVELRLRLEDMERLKQVNAWLRDMPADEPIVPLRERSLEIFGDEKLLEELTASSRLVGKDRLTLDLLRARAVHPPFFYKVISQAPVLLVIENHHPFDSFARTLRPGSGVGMVAYGGGNAFVGSVTYAADLPQSVEEIRYFGDIDAEGLRIPIDAGRVARAAGLPDVLPAADLYDRLLRIGRVANGPKPISRAAAERMADWLPERLRPEVETLLAQGKRIAQEAVGLKALRA